MVQKKKTDRKVGLTSSNVMGKAIAEVITDGIPHETLTRHVKK